jgi:hypothetical protein
MNKMPLIYLLAVPFLLGGCESTPSAPSKTVTPLDSCLQEVKDRHWNCIVGALAPSGNFRFDPVQKNICEDRKMQQEDRCRARFK